MNMIIGKKQIILASLVLGLGIAVYLNWQYSKADMDLIATSTLEQTTNYGEAQYVDKPNMPQEAVDAALNQAAAPQDDETFFVEAKMSRQKARDEAVETLATMLGDAALAPDQKAELAMKATDLASSIEKEGKIENLLKAKGFTDVMVYYDTARADIIVKTEGLDAAQASQIKDIVLKETSITPENISIVEIN